MTADEMRSTTRSADRMQGDGVDTGQRTGAAEVLQPSRPVLVRERLPLGDGSGDDRDPPSRRRGFAPARTAPESPRPSRPRHTPIVSHEGSRSGPSDAPGARWDLRYPRPVHIACIMDGNGRWATRRDLPRTAGHTAGEENLAEVVRLCVRRDVDWLTVFGFSTENWVRPRREVRHILGLHRKLFGRVAELNELGVRVQWIGRPFDEVGARTPVFVQRAIAKAIADTAHNSRMTLTVAFDYGSRAEIAHAARAARARGGETSVEAIRSGTYLPEMPPVDVMIRTSGERRVSNFLLWQSVGCPIHFTDNTWPDFSADDLDAAIRIATAGASRP